MTTPGLGSFSQRPAFYAAARRCDDLADEIVKDVDDIYKLQGVIADGFQGLGGTSLELALVREAGLVTSAAGVLRAAAANLRRAGMQVQ